MMKYLFLITPLFFFGSIECVGQYSKWKIGMSLTPQYSLTLTQNDLVDAESQFGFTTQVLIGYRLNKRIELISGLTYELNSIDMLDYTPIFGCDLTEGVADLKNSWLEHNGRVHYLGIPLHVKYNFSTEGNTGYVRLGYNQLFRVSGSSITTLVECNGVNTFAIESHLRNMTSRIDVGIGFEIASDVHSTFLLEAVGAYTVSGVFKDHPVFENPNILDIGLRLGVLFGGK